MLEIVHILEMILIVGLICTVLYLYYHNNCKKTVISEKFTDTIKVYLLTQKILNISKADLVVFFKYKYEPTFISTHFMFSIDNKNNIEHELMCNIPVKNTFSVKIFKTDDKTLHEFYKNDIINCDISKNTHKVYFQNLFKKHIEQPIGYIKICYEQEHKISDRNIRRILDIIIDIKKLIL